MQEIMARVTSSTDTTSITKYNAVVLCSADKAWCDFVVRTNKDMHIERIYRDREWWTLQLAKCKKFYFSALLPELACPRYRKGGIREPENTVLV